MKHARDFFTPEEREKISKAVLEAEKQTSGEIVPVVATASGRYDRAEDIGGLLLGLIALTASWLRYQRILPVEGDWAHGQRLTLGLGWLLLIVVGGFIVGAGITSRVGWLRRLLVSHREKRQEVERGAWEAFGRFRVGRRDGHYSLRLGLRAHGLCSRRRLYRLEARVQDLGRNPQRHYRRHSQRAPSRLFLPGHYSVRRASHAALPLSGR